MTNYNDTLPEIKYTDKDYIAYYEKLKQLSKEYGKISFVYIDNKGSKEEYKFTFVDGDSYINDKKNVDLIIRKMIASIDTEISPLVIKSLTNYMSVNKAMGLLRFASLADFSAKFNEPIRIDLTNKPEEKVLKITRENKKAKFMLNNEEITEKEAEELMNEDNITFLTGVKRAKKRLMLNKYGASGESKKEDNDFSKISIEEGKIRINIDQFLGTKIKSDGKVRKQFRSKIQDEILRPSQNGYLDD